MRHPSRYVRRTSERTRSTFHRSSKEPIKQVVKYEHSLGSLKLEDACGELEDQFAVLEAALCEMNKGRWLVIRYLIPWFRSSYLTIEEFGK